MEKAKHRTVKEEGGMNDQEKAGRKRGPGTAIRYKSP